MKDTLLRALPNIEHAYVNGIIVIDPGRFGHVHIVSSCETDAVTLSFHTFDELNHMIDKVNELNKTKWKEN